MDCYPCRTAPSYFSSIYLYPKFLSGSGGFMSRLIKMVLIDSYVKGKITEIRMDGNTNVNGGNGYGKTTLLRILPVFYGASPRKIVSSEGINKGFVDWYLPRRTSYIAYEYERDNRLCTVILSRKADASTPAFRFVEQPVDKSWFIQKDEKGIERFVNNQDLSRRLQLNEIAITQSVGVDDYKNIIQSSHRFNHTNAQKRDLINRYRRQFAFPGQGSSMENVDLILTAILKRKPSIFSIKEILETILANQHVFQKSEFSEEGLSLSGYEKAITDWINGRNTWQKIAAQVENIKDLEQQSHTYSSNQRLISELKSRSLRVKEKLVTDQSDYAVLIENHDKEISYLQLDYNEKKKQHDQQLDEIDKNKRTVEREIQELKREKFYFEEEQKVHEISPLVEQYKSGELDRKLHQIEEQKKAIEEQSENTLNRFELRKQELESDKRSLMDAKKNQVLETQQRFDQEQHKIMERRAIDIQSALKKTGIDNQRFNESIVEHSSHLAELKAGLNHLLTPPDIVAAIEEQNELIKEVEADIKSQSEEIQNLQQQGYVLQRNIDQALHELNQFDRDMEAAHLELERVKKLHEPQSGSLLKYLRDNVQGWENHIAKVINPELLERDDLHPSEVEKALSVYGVEIDLLAIEQPSFSDFSQLEAMLQSIDEKIAQQMLQRGKKVGQLEAIQAEIKEINDAVSRLQMLQRKHYEALSVHIKDREELEIQSQQKKLELKEKIQEECHVCETKIKDLKQQIKVKKAQSQEQENKIKNQAERAIQELSAKKQEQVEQIERRHLIESSDIEQRLRDNEQERQQIITEKGLDPIALQKIQNDYKKARQLREKAIDSQKILSHYQDFIQQRWPQFEPLQAQKDELSQELQQLEDNWRNMDEQLTEKIGTSQAQKNDLITKSQNIEIELKQLDGMIIEIGDLAQETSQTLSINAVHTAERLHRDWLTLKEKRHQLVQQGRSLLATIRRAFRQATGQPQEYYEKLIDDIDAERWDEQLEWVPLSKGLLNYIENHHLEHRRMLSSDILTIGDQVTAFGDHLQRVHDNIKRLGNQVTQQAQAVIAGFDIIEGLSIQVSSSMEELDFWPSLKSFAQSHHNWQGLQMDQLPDEDYLLKLKNIQHLMGGSGISVKVRDRIAIKITVRDNGIEKHAHRDQDLEHISSNGISYLILILIYTALVNMLRGGKSMQLVWPIDELRDFSKVNVGALLKLLQQHHIFVFSAFPDADPEILKHYAYPYKVGKDKTLYLYGSMQEQIKKDAELKNLIAGKLHDLKQNSEQEQEKEKAE